MDIIPDKKGPRLFCERPAGHSGMNYQVDRVTQAPRGPNLRPAPARVNVLPNDNAVEYSYQAVVLSRKKLSNH